MKKFLQNVYHVKDFFAYNKLYKNSQDVLTKLT